jgi:uncharacterized membrane protein YgaE (UPF0421/DUF939 family)
MKIQLFLPVFIKNIALVVGAFFGGFYFTTFFHEPTSMVGGLWAVISAIIVIEASNKETYTSAKNRISGSLIGAILSGVYLVFFSFSIVGFAATIGVGVLICFLLGIPQSVKLTGITISVVIIVSTIAEELHPFLNAGLRLIESAIGTGIAVLVAFVAFSFEDSNPRKDVPK